MQLNSIQQLKPLLLLALLSCGQNQSNQTATQPPPPTPQQQVLSEMEKDWKPMYDIQVDTSIFNHHKVGTYTSDKYENAMIAVAIFPMESFEAEKTKFKNRKAKDGEQEKFKKVVNLGGREMLVRKFITKRDDLELAFHQYQVKGDEQQVIMLNGACKPSDEAAMDKVFEQAAQSVRLKTE